MSVNTTARPQPPIGADLNGHKPVSITTGGEPVAATESQLATGGQPAPDNSPYWLTGPCPAWCIEEHYGSDTGADRACWSEQHAITLTAEHGREAETGEHKAGGIWPQAQWKVWTPDAVTWLIQEYREAEPRVSLDLGWKIGTHLTLAEADALRELLVGLLDAAIEARR